MELKGIVMETATEEEVDLHSLAQDLIVQECDAVKDLLLKKNREYGNSALEPINVFTDLDAEQQINVRIDDKLKRIQTIRELDQIHINEDTEMDLIGYLILKRVARIWPR